MIAPQTAKVGTVVLECVLNGSRSARCARTCRSESDCTLTIPCTHLPPHAPPQPMTATMKRTTLP